MTVAIIDLPQSNSSSVQYWLDRNKKNSRIISSPSNYNYEAYILPGVGSYDPAINFLRASKIDKWLLKIASKNKKIVGICLGMQLMFHSSEEGKEKGLGLLKGKVERIKKGKMYVPNIGWREIENLSKIEDNSLLPNSNFYFMHSYAVKTKKFLNHYGNSLIYNTFCNSNILSCFKHESLVGFQFHPEKSYRNGDKAFKFAFCSNE